MSNEERTIAMLTALRGIGAHTALDDFGAARSSRIATRI